jgi:hypothetical protein
MLARKRLVKHRHSSLAFLFRLNENSEHPKSPKNVYVGGCQEGGGKLVVDSWFSHPRRKHELEAEEEKISKDFISNTFQIPLHRILLMQMVRHHATWQQATWLGWQQLGNRHPGSSGPWTAPAIHLLERGDI